MAAMVAWKLIATAMVAWEWAQWPEQLVAAPEIPEKLAHSLAYFNYSLGFESELEVSTEVSATVLGVEPGSGWPSLTAMMRRSRLVKSLLVSVASYSIVWPLIVREPPSVLLINWPSTKKLGVPVTPSSRARPSSNLSFLSIASLVRSVRNWSRLPLPSETSVKYFSKS